MKTYPSNAQTGRSSHHTSHQSNEFPSAPAHTPSSLHEKEWLLATFEYEKFLDHILRVKLTTAMIWVRDEMIDVCTIDDVSN